MKNLRLRLKGFIGIKKGLGLEEIDLDLSGLSGLIALSGPNGHGKTTILDNLQPYRILPSRKRALIKHVYLRDSEKEFEFNFHGDHFRTLLKIDAQSERSEGYIWRNEQSLVDGKLVNYDAAIREIFGSQELFVNSVFCAQGSKKLNEMRKGELQNLFAEFLRLYRYVEWEKTSGTAQAIYTSKAEALAMEIEYLKKAGEKVDPAKEQIKLLESARMSARNDLEILKGGKRTAEDEIKRLEKASAGNEILRESIKNQEASFNRIEKEIEKIKTEGRGESQKLRDEKRKIDLEIMSLNSVLANEAEIRTAASEVNDLEDKYEELKAKQERAFKERESMALIVRMATDELSIFKYDNQIIMNAERISVNNIKAGLELAEKLASGIDARDPECQSTTCSFIVDALSAAKSIPVIKENLAKANAKLLDLAKRHGEKVDLLNEEVVAVTNRYEDAKKVHDEIRKELEMVNNRLQARKKLARDLPKVEVAASKKEGFGKQSKDLAQKVAERDSYWLDIIGRKSKELQEVKDVISKLKADIVEDIDRKLDQAKKDVESIESSITRMVDTEIPRIEADIIKARADLKEIEKAVAEHERKSEIRDSYVLEAVDWAYLKNACGKDGLRSLEIDSVVPVISGYANDLLFSTFGPGYAVKFRTQAEDSMKEVFDILVIGEDGSETLLDELSGGERVWILKSLRLALTLISKEKSGIDFKSCLADEEDGALDVENAKNFIRLYRSFMAEGNFDDCFFISHKPQAIAMADHIIKFNDGGITID